MRFLIIEDQADVSRLVTALLKPYGDCVVAEDGRSGLDAVIGALDSGASFDALFLDIMMPNMNGHETLDAIRKLEEARKIYPPEAIKIIMTTALADRENVMTAFRNQADAYLVKPILQKSLLEAMTKAGLEV